MCLTTVWKQTGYNTDPPAGALLSCCAHMAFISPEALCSPLNLGLEVSDNLCLGMTPDQTFTQASMLCNGSCWSLYILYYASGAHTTDHHRLTDVFVKTDRVSLKWSSGIGEYSF